MAILRVSLVLVVFTTGCAQSRWTYPVAKSGDVVDTYHGVAVPDPYRWLEDPDSADSRAWIDQENALTFGYLEHLEQRPAIRARLEKLWDFERWGVPFREADRFFFHKNDGLQNQAVLWVAEGPDAEPRVLLDPNALSADGTVAVAFIAPSKDAKKLAYGLSSGGSDWIEIKVRDIDTGADLPDYLKWVKFSGASWLPDGSGFYYSRYDEPKGAALQDANYFQKLYFHKLGTAQSEDVLIYERPDQKEWGFGAGVTEDGAYLVVHVWRGTDPKNAIYYVDLAKGGAPLPLLDEFDAAYEYLGNDGPLFYFKSDLEAPRGRVIAIDLRDPRPRELLAHAAETLEWVSLVGDRLITGYLEHAKSRVKVFDLQGHLEREVELPTLGSAWGFGGRRSDRDTYFAFTSFTFPSAVYHYDLASGAVTQWKQPRVDFDPAAYETRQVFVKSKDGTELPMFLVHKKGLEPGPHPTLLYGYGGFDISLTPSFSVANLVWLELGGVYAMPNLRGGGEYGEDWHQAGILAKKQNVFDDFIASAEWLIANGLTTSKHLAISGRSNGGLLVGACMTQRPELFGVALPGVGVLDMLRYHTFTIGWAWASDYGTVADAEQFAALRAYSPLHNLKPGTHYPATLVTTADHDDRVVPAHSFKFAAALQAAHAGDTPVMIRIETQAGHGAGKPTAKLIDEAADSLAFVVDNLAR